jgi:ribosomal-protein-alanine N-acetyltransferase
MSPTTSRTVPVLSTKRLTLRAATPVCGHQIFRLNRIDAWTLPGNGASDRVLEKSGFKYEGTLRQKAWFKRAFHDFRVFGRITADAGA